MKIHEYQGKAILAAHGVPVPKGRAAYNPAEAVEIGKELGFPVVCTSGNCATVWVGVPTVTATVRRLSPIAHASRPRSSSSCRRRSGLGSNGSTTSP